MKASKKRRALFVIAAVVVACVTGFSFVIRSAARCFSLADDATLAAAMISFSSGELFSSQPTEEATVKKIERKPLAEKQNEAAAETPEEDESGQTYPVVETNIVAGNLSYENINIKNTTATTPDVEKLLGAELPFSISDDHRVQVLIVHTHTCERYMKQDRDFYFDSFYPRTTDPDQSVVAVGEAIEKELKARGIGVVHDVTLHDYPSYEGSYDRSFETISSYLQKYPTIRIVFDIHRDSMTAEDNTKYKPTFTYQGKKAAQIMIMSGHDESGDFSFWEENLTFALKLQKRCEDLYPGMTRPLYFGDFTYNMNANNGSLLIEVGTDANTVDEAVRSGGFLGNALASLMKDAKNADSNDNNQR